MQADFHIEVETVSLPQDGQTCCGDVCETRKLKEENRILAVLSHGMGYGIKANILASMTASMAIQFALNHETALRTAEFIINTLPFDQERKITHAGFSMVDINYRGEANLVGYRNPWVLWISGGLVKELPRTERLVDHPTERQYISQSSVKLNKEDRLIVFSDGVSQSGLHTSAHPLGWLSALPLFVTDAVNTSPFISAKQLAQKIVQRALHNDGGKLCHDATCCVIYCRKPRKLIIATGPPFHKHHDKYLAETVTGFEGKKVICGGTTAIIVARELNKSIEVDLDTKDPQLPPLSSIQGIDLVTEGILTLVKTTSLIEQDAKKPISGNGPAEELAKMLLGSDKITLMVGTRINEAHHDPTLPVELEMRRNVIKKLANILEVKYLKEVGISYL